MYNISDYVRATKQTECGTKEQLRNKQGLLDRVSLQKSPPYRMFILSLWTDFHAFPQHRGNPGVYLRNRQSNVRDLCWEGTQLMGMGSFTGFKEADVLLCECPDP